MKFLLLLSLPLVLLDQLTKWLIQQNIPYGDEMPIIPGFFSLVHVNNTGAAFSLLQGNNLFFIVLATVALLVVLFLLMRDRWLSNPSNRFHWTTKVSLALLTAGIVGNLIDRLIKGSVVDFLHFYIRQYAWPSFNLADSCICIAAGLLILSSFRKQGPVPERS
ncbi:MAG TPA: signal peptidase II [Chthoniobacterales bacterium]|nr:signal peptidase II [Chthoniobacterales bacterium]